MPFTWYVVVFGPVMISPSNRTSTCPGVAIETSCGTEGLRLLNVMVKSVFAGAARHLVSKAIAVGRVLTSSEAPFGLQAAPDPGADAEAAAEAGGDDAA